MINHNNHEVYIILLILVMILLDSLFAGMINTFSKTTMGMIALPSVTIGWLLVVSKLVGKKTVDNQHITDDKV